MINKTRFELATTGFKPKFPDRQFRRYKACADGSFSLEVFEEDKNSILRSKDFDVQTLLDTNPALLKPVAALHPNQLAEHDSVSRVASSMSSDLPADFGSFDPGSSIDPGSSTVPGSSD